MNKFKVRNLFQLVFLGLWILLIIYLIPIIFGNCHQFCPYAAVCFGAMTFSGFFAYLPMVIIGLLIAVSTIFIGRKFCGYICFIGALQEQIFRLNRKKEKNRLPPTIHKFLSIFKYLVFLLTLLLAIFLLQYKFMDFCPIIALSFLNSITFLGIISLFFILVIGFFVERFWCRYLCPYAALMNVFQFIGSKLGIRRQKIKRNLEVCIDCYLCTRNCPMNIDLTQFEEISDPNCIHCLKCIEKCPKDKCLTC